MSNDRGVWIFSISLYRPTFPHLSAKKCYPLSFPIQEAFDQKFPVRPVLECRRLGVVAGKDKRYGPVTVISVSNIGYTFLYSYTMFGLFSKHSYHKREFLLKHKH